MINEKRLIGYDHIAFGEFTQSLRNTLEVYDPYSDGYEDGMGRIEDWLEYNCVDAVEVVHGRWIDAYGIRKSKCENCCVAFGRVMEDCNYCPNCGADMRDGDGNG